MSTRENYVDNIRVCLTAMVILHHTAITYGAPGGWYYREEVSNGMAESLLLTVFVATNQAYFMGLFFFLSSYFMPPSVKKKGKVRFFIDRLTRLGIPIVFYSVVISPATIYLSIMNRYPDLTFIDYYMNREEWISVGVLWFTCALLVFTSVFVIAYRNSDVPATTHSAPGNKQILAAAIGLGLISFIVRIQFPIGWTLDPVGFQLAHFPQYIAMFAAGIAAYRNGWLGSMKISQGRVFSWFALVLILVGFPGIFLFKELAHADFDVFMGGLTLHSFVNSMWEQLLGVALIVSVVIYFREKWTTQSSLFQKLSRSAYAVYIIHPLVLVSLSIAFRDIQLMSVFKFALTGILSVVISFALGFLLTRVPIINRII